MFVKRNKALAIVLGLVMAMSAFAALGPALMADAQTPLSNPNGNAEFNADAIGINAGATGFEITDTAATDHNTIAAAANSVLLIGVGEYADAAPTAVAAVYSGHSYTVTTLEAGTTSASFPLLKIYGVLISTAETVTYYVNFSADEYYAATAIDLTNTVILSTYSAGTGVSDGDSTAGTCSATTTVANEEVFAVIGGKSTTAAATYTLAGTETESLHEATTSTDFLGMEDFYSVDTSTGAYSSTATVSATEDWEESCVGIEPAVVPSAPTALAAVMTTTTAALTWTDFDSQAPGWITAAEVYDATYSGSCGTFSAIAAAVTPFTSYMVTGLTSGTNYCFEVTDSNSTGASVDSSSIIGVTLHAPLAPTGLTATAQPDSTTQINLRWNLDTGTLSNQTIHESTTSTCTTTNQGTFVNVADVLATTYTFTSLTAGTVYYFSAQAWNATGEGAWAACVSATTNSNPSAPTGLAATVETEFAVTLTWTNPSGGTPQNDTIYWAAASSCSSFAPNMAISLGVASTGTASGLTPATEYCFEVSLWSAAGTQSESSGLLVTTLTGVPNAVTLFQSTSQTATTLTFTWSNPTPSSGTLVNATLFYGASCGVSVYGAAGNPGTWTSNLNVGSAATTATITGLTVNTQYCANVALWTQGGQGNQTISVSATTLNAVPGAVTGLTYSSASHSSVTLTWSQPSGIIVNDTLAYGTTSACAGTLIFISMGITISSDIGSLASATTYYWKVAASTNGGLGQFSSCVTGATQGATPPAPYLVASQLTSSTTTYITWNNPAGYSLTDSDLYLSNPDGSCGTWASGFSPLNVGVVTQNYELTGLTPGDTYCVQISAVDGQSPLSTPIYVTTLSAVSPPGIIGGVSIIEYAIVIGVVGITGLVVLNYYRSGYKYSR